MRKESRRGFNNGNEELVGVLMTIGISAKNLAKMYMNLGFSGRLNPRQMTDAQQSALNSLWVIMTLFSQASKRARDAFDVKEDPLTVKNSEIPAAVVRASLIRKARRGHADEVKELLADFGFDSIYDIPPCCHAAVLKAAKKIRG